MAILSLDCPHCMHQQLGFTSHGEYQVPGKPKYWGMFFKCPRCHKPVSAVVHQEPTAGQPNTPGQYQGCVLQAKHIRVQEVHPLAKALQAPDHSPARVARFMVQALDNAKREQWDAAALLFRRVIEEAANILLGEAGKAGSLKQRIDRLDHEHITPAMKAWAHTVRLDGNEAAHGDADATKESVDELSAFTELFLMYAFTLPGMLQARQPKPPEQAKPPETV